MKTNSLKVNYFYNMIFTCLNFIFPLITSPYVSRVLGSSNLGKVNLVSAFVNWIILISNFGITSYGLREIAKIKNNQDKLNKVFSELVVIRFIATLIVLVIYFIIIFNIKKFYLEINLYLIFSINVILNIFNIDWFYQGIENYRYITIRSGSLKFISLLAMFMMIKSERNYVLYGALTIFASSFGNLLNCLYSKNFVSFTIKNLNLKRHLKKLNIFFISSLVVSCYTNLDQVFLGFLVNDSAVAFFNRSRQVVVIITSLTLALNTVIVPRATFYYENCRQKYNTFILDSINYVYILTLPCMIGIMFLAKEILMLLGGFEFANVSNLLSLISINILISSIQDWNYNQILLPTNNEKKGTKTQATMAVISIISNFILLPRIGYIGAGISWVLVEIFGMIQNLTYTKKLINYRIITRELVKYIFSTLMIILAIVIIKFRFNNYLIIIVLSLIVCPIIYFSTLILLKEKYTMQTLATIKKKLVK